MRVTVAARREGRRVALDCLCLDAAGGIAAGRTAEVIVPEVEIRRPRMALPEIELHEPADRRRRLIEAAAVRDAAPTAVIQPLRHSLARGSGRGHAGGVDPAGARGPGRADRGGGRGRGPEARGLWPGAAEVPCFDTAFHATQPEITRWFALHEFGVERYGFQGLNHERVAGVLPDHLGLVTGGRVIVTHLGGGSGPYLMRDRRSVATTMGMTS